MKRVLVKTGCLILSLVMALSLFTACGAENTAAPNEPAEAYAMDTQVTVPCVTLIADGHEVTVEDTAGKTLQQLLEQARLTVDEGDLLTVDPAQILDGTLVVRLVRKCTVEIVMTSEEGQTRCVLSMMEGTVADALEAAGIKLEANQIVNFELDEALADGMQIQITQEVVEEETEPEETEPEETQPATTAPAAPSTPKPTEPKPKPTEPKPTEPKPTEPKPTEPKPTEPKPTEPEPTEPKPTEPEKTIVSVEVYEDCDGSGHGVKVITYSDGTQEEVYF